MEIRSTGFPTLRMEFLTADRIGSCGPDHEAMYNSRKKNDSKDTQLWLHLLSPCRPISGLFTEKFLPANLADPKLHLRN
jgi:hypothetical protein